VVQGYKRVGDGVKVTFLVFDEESIAAFRERVKVMILALCSEEFLARPWFMG
jgi:hypothetical protein